MNNEFDNGNFTDGNPSVTENTESGVSPEENGVPVPENNPPAAGNGAPPPRYALPPQYAPQGNPRGSGFPPPPPAGYPQNRYAPYAAPLPPEKKRLSKGWTIGIILVIAVMFAVIVILSVLVAHKAADYESIRNKVREQTNVLEGFSQNEAEAPEAQKNGKIVINLPVSEKPEVNASDYEDEESGRFTSEGLAKYVMPSQVLIGIYNDTPYEMSSAGSGIILTADGYILTNAHVIDGAHNIKTILNDGSQYEAEITGIDRTSDIAVIKIDAEGLIAADLGDSDSAALGEEVAVLGAAGAFEPSITFGHISALNREIQTDYAAGGKLNCIQTDAALNPGNSGGALVNMYGQVIGISVGGMNHLVFDGIGFAIEINDVISIAEDLIANGFVPGRSRLGITYLSLNTDLASEYGVPIGLCVIEIDKSCNIALTDIQPYDIITAIDGKAVYDSVTVSKAMEGKYAGQYVRLSVYRKTMTDEEYEFTVDVILEQKYDTN